MGAVSPYKNGRFVWRTPLDFVRVIDRKCFLFVFYYVFFINKKHKKQEYLTYHRVFFINKKHAIKNMLP